MTPHMKNTLRLLFLSVFIFLLQLAPLKATDEPEIGIVEHLNEHLPNDIFIINEKSDTVNLIDLIDKPTVINFVYFRCPGICSPLMDGIAEVVDKSGLEIGVDYQIFTISFDARETIDLGHRKKANYLNQMAKKEAASLGWQFFVADSLNIAKATEALGFKYKRTGNDFLHAASVMMISPEGKIVRYLNGIYFLPLEWKLAIVEASQEKSGPTINKILQYCYTYDPEGQAYVLNVTRIAGTIIIFLSVLFFLLLLLWPRKTKTSNTTKHA